ncbi:hypothetical protein GCM10027074_67750 [Streptomyces deserti]
MVVILLERAVVSAWSYCDNDREEQVMAAEIFRTGRVCPGAPAGARAVVIAGCAR